MKRNEKIQKVFDDYADNLPDQSHLANEAAKQLASRKNKKSVWRWLAPVAAAFVAVVLCFTVLDGVWDSSNGNHGNDSTMDKPNSEPLNPEQMIAYDVTQATGMVADTAQAEQVFNVKAVDGDDSYTVVYQKYYAFYLEGQTEIAYYRAYLGIMANGSLTEVYVIAENPKYRNNALSDRFADFYASGNTRFCYGYERGEYTTEAQFVARGYRFFAMTLGGNDDGTEILKKLF